MAINLAPVPPYHYLVATAVGVAVCLLLLRLVLPRRRDALGRRPLTRLIVLLSSLAAALLLTAAAHNPQIRREPTIPQAHLAVVLDVSDSVLRDQASWNDALDEIGQLLVGAVNAMPEVMAASGTGSLMTFGRGVNTVQRQIPLADLPTAFRRLTPTDFAPGDATNIQAALDQAGQNIRRAGQRGAVLLITDGNQTDGNAWESAQTLARLGIPIYVYPLESQSPLLAITSAYLPAQIDGRVEATLRMVLQNHSNQEVPARLTIYQNPGLDNPHTRFGVAKFAEVPFAMPAVSWAPRRYPIRFEGVGLQFVDLILTPVTGEGEHRRRFYTHVTQPLRVLAVGGDNRWAVALSPENVTVAQIAPIDLPLDYNFQEIDALVISGVAAGEFRPGVLAAVARAVNDNGLGLFVINGDHAGGDEKTPTILMTYENTPIEPLLPVTTDPRVIFDEPPSRHVIIMIDKSGSMSSGRRLAQAKEIAIYIVQNLLRETDFVDVIAFNHDPHPLINNRLMYSAGKSIAIDRINSISGWGGTNALKALASIADREFTQCGLIFISDGEFGDVAARPDCRATVFAIAKNIPQNASIRQIADPFIVDDSFSPAGITIPYFDPEPRDKFFEPGEYVPLTAGYFSAQIDRLPVPNLPLEGTAVTGLKDEEGVVLTAARPRFTDPVLAYKPNGAGYVGAFTSGIPLSWLDNEEGRQAIEAWIKRTVPYVERDRYDLRLQDRGSAIAIQIGITAELDVEIEVTDLTVVLEIDGEPSIPITMSRQDMATGFFLGEVRPPRTTTTQSATLVIKETGPHAIFRPQRIPMLIGPAAPIEQVATAEATSFGLNTSLLRAIAEAGGGLYNPPEGTTFFHTVPAETPVTEFWPHLSLLAAFFYLLAVATQRLEP